MTGLWFSPGTPVSSTNKTDLHDITEILLKVAKKTTDLPQVTDKLVSESYCTFAVGLLIYVSVIPIKYI